MTDLLERSIRQTLSDVVATAPQPGPAPADVVLAPAARAGRAPILAVAAAVVVLGALGLVALTRRDAAPTPAAGDAPALTTVTDPPPSSAVFVQPAVTLPAAGGLAEAPITVPVGSPLSYWRFLPDLDISERATAEGGTELCYRTPAGTGCIADTFESPEVGVIPADGAAILLVRPGIVAIDPPPADPSEPRMQMGPQPTVVHVTRSDGATVTADVVYGTEFGVGHARVALPDGVTIASAWSS